MNDYTISGVWNEIKKAALKLGMQPLDIINISIDQDIMPSELAERIKAHGMKDLIENHEKYPWPKPENKNAY